MNWNELINIINEALQWGAIILLAQCMIEGFDIYGRKK